MPTPIRNTSTQPTFDPASAPTAPPSSPESESPETVREAATDQVHAGRAGGAGRAGRPTRTPAARLGTAVANVYERGGIHAVSGFLETHPEVVAGLAGSSRDQVEAQLERSIGGSAGAVMEELQDHVDAHLRQMVIGEVRSNVNERLSLLGRVGHDLEQNLDAYRDAPADSPKGRVAAAFGVRGDAGDVGRIREHVQDASDGYRALLSQFQGQTWSPGDFDQTTRRLAFDAGMGAGAAGTFMAETLSHRSHVPADQVHAALEVAEGLEIAHGAVHLAHAMHGGAAAAAGVALPLVVAVGGFFLAREIHHAVEERREAFQQAAHTVGIR